MTTSSPLSQWLHHRFSAMGTQVDLWVDADPPEAQAAFAEAEGCFRDAEAALSRLDPASELSRLNARSGEWVPVSRLLWDVLALALDYAFATLRNDLVVARGFDDRIGAFVILEAVRLLVSMNPKASIYAVATVQEEIGLRGAKTSAFGVDPKVGIAVDVGFATDTPGMEAEKKKVGEFMIGKGPIIARGPNVNPPLFKLIVETAEEAEIPYQVEGAPRGTGTDANAIQLARAGVATGLISVPTRYMHSPCEIVHLTDLENACKLIAHTVAKIDEKTNFLPS